PQIDALNQGVPSCTKLRIKSFVLSQGKENIGSGKDFQALNAQRTNRQAVRQGHILQTKEGAILDPTIRKPVVTNHIAVRGTGNIGLLSLILPAIKGSCRLVGKAIHRLQLSALVIIDIIAYRKCQQSIKR